MYNYYICFRYITDSDDGYSDLFLRVGCQINTKDTIHMTKLAICGKFPDMNLKPDNIFIVNLIELKG